MGKVNAVDKRLEPRNPEEARTGCNILTKLDWNSRCEIFELYGILGRSLIGAFKSVRCYWENLDILFLGAQLEWEAWISLRLWSCCREWLGGSFLLDVC